MGWCLFYGNSSCSQLIRTYKLKWSNSAQSVVCFQLKVSTPIYLMKVQRRSLPELFGILGFHQELTFLLGKLCEEGY